MEENEPRAPRSAPTGLRGLLRNIGPGVVVSGSVVGSGELLVTTRMGAEVGFVFMWGVILACLVKFFIQLELGRQCILRNKTTVQILDLVPGWRFRGTSWIAWLCVGGYFSVTVAVIGILGSVAGLMVALFPALSEYVWAIVIFLLMSLLLWRGLYEDLETMVLVLVASFSLVVIGSVLMLQGTSYAINGAEIASGFRFAMPADGAFVALALMGSVGATAVELFMYPYWIKEKGYPDFVGPREDTAAWRARYRGWMRVLTADALVCTAIALFITCAYYLLGASVLARLNVIPEGMRVVEQVSLIFTETIGGWAYYLFMFGGFCTLFSTLLVFAASSGRIGVDFLHQVGMKSLDNGENYARWIRFLQVGFPFLWLLFILVDPRTLDFVLKGANANNMLLIPLAYAVLHLAMRARAEERMSLWGELALLVTIWAIISFTAINLIQLFSS
jgi:Mn2+/Fe2+ NRAMP family transporter